MPGFWTDTIQGKVKNYRCVSPASVDIHLKQLREAMAVEQEISRLLDMIEDQELLMTLRHRSCRYCDRP